MKELSDKLHMWHCKQLVYQKLSLLGKQDKLYEDRAMK